MREKLIENDIITIFAVPESLVIRDDEEAIIYSVSVELILLTRQFPFFPTFNSLEGLTTYCYNIMTRKHCFVIRLYVYIH